MFVVVQMAAALTMDEPPRSAAVSCNQISRQMSRLRRLRLHWPVYAALRQLARRVSHMSLGDHAATSSLSLRLSQP